MKNETYIVTRYKTLKLLNESFNVSMKRFMAYNPSSIEWKWWGYGRV